MHLKHRASLASMSLLSCTGSQPTSTNLEHSHTPDTTTTTPPAQELIADTREKVYLTIDDGPSKYTKAILDFLNQS
ncbi:MAG: hypothetical protein Q4B28_02445 [bacterium]|nr:hypothetical protein [bacterium]